MAKKKQPEDDLPETGETIDAEPVELEEPEAADEETAATGRAEVQAIWLRGLWMLLFAMLIALGRTLLGALTVLQFLWLLFTRERNVAIADFGASLAQWFQDVARFQVADTEEKPFPFAPWKA